MKRSRPHAARRIVLAVALAGLAAGCSKGDSGVRYTATEQPYVDALAKAVDGQAPGLGADDSRCVAGSFVRAIGVDRFKAAKVAPSDIGADFDVATVSGADKSILTNGQANRFADAVQACGSASESAALFSLREASGLDQVSAAETLRCVAKRLNAREARVLNTYYPTLVAGTEELRAKTIAVLTLKACGVAVQGPPG